MNECPKHGPFEEHCLGCHEERRLREERVVSRVSELPLGPTGNYPDGRHGLEDKGELQIAIAEHERQVLIAFGTKISWMTVYPEQARQMAVALMNKANEADIDPFIRADGSCRCTICGDTYRNHPHDFNGLAKDQEPFLRVRCDGRRLKL